MINALQIIPTDPLLKLIGEFTSDERLNKIDLGVGVYRNENGITPVMSAVKRAEKRLVENQESKAYIGLAGDIEFVDELRNLAFGTHSGLGNRITGIQTPGSSAALRLAGDLMKRATPNATIWIGLPCWANHIPVFEAAGVQIKYYQYYDEAQRAPKVDEMNTTLEAAKSGDFVLLQGCCHNPTGADLTIGDWKGLSQICVDSGIIPIIDIAYQGLGRGLDEDMAGVRHMLSQVPEAVVTVSCSKNFGLYRDRVGAIYVLAETETMAAIARSNLFAIARTSYSMPPDHGAAIVKTVLQIPDLNALWQSELTQMRERITTVRQSIIAAWGVGPVDLSYLGTDQGMFSMLPLNKDQIETLRREYGIYMAGNGRINIAGLSEGDAERFVTHLKSIY